LVSHSCEDYEEVDYDEVMLDLEAEELNDIDNNDYTI
jgi:hypothetical protein